MKWFQTNISFPGDERQGSRLKWTVIFLLFVLLSLYLTRSVILWGLTSSPETHQIQQILAGVDEVRVFTQGTIRGIGPRRTRPTRWKLRTVRKRRDAGRLVRVISADSFTKQGIMVEHLWPMKIEFYEKQKLVTTVYVRTINTNLPELWWIGGLLDGKTMLARRGTLFHLKQLGYHPDGLRP